MRERSPHFLTGDHPFVAVENGAGLDVGEIGAGVGLGIALAPDLGPAQDARQHGSALVVGAEVHDRGPEEPFADDPDPARPAGARVLLEEDHLLHERRAAAAVLGGPTEPDPSVTTQLLLPRPPLVEALVLVAGPAPAAYRREGAVEPVGEPRTRGRRGSAPARE